MNDEQLKQQVEKALDQRARDLDGATLSRLRQARTRAIEQPRSWWHGIHWSLAGGATALASVTLVAVLVMRAPAPEALPLDPAADALEIATLEHDLELIEQMDFYTWLETQELESFEADHSTENQPGESALAG